MALNAGSQAPKFSLNDKNGTPRTLGSFNKRFLVLYFYPRDDTPGCTIEAKDFEKNLSAFTKLNAEVVGISGMDEVSKKRFCEKHGLKRLLLLSDKDFSTSKEYGVYGEHSFMGRAYTGISRTTFVLDRSRRILKVFENVIPLGHAQQVIEFIKKSK